MLRLTKPSDRDIRRLIESQRLLDFTYPEIGATDGNLPAGYTIDHVRLQLGTGVGVFEAAKAALRRWDEFRLGWVEQFWPDTPIEPGHTVAVLARVFRVWSLNACRIIYVVDEPGPVSRFGFGYGTLPEHAESGEERFLVEWRPEDDSVWYDIRAFFRPRQLLPRLGWLFVHQKVNQFRRDSAVAMKRAVELGT